MADDNLGSAIVGALEGFRNAYVPFKKAEYEDILSRRKSREEKDQELQNAMKLKGYEQSIKPGERQLIYDANGNVVKDITAEHGGNVGVNQLRMPNEMVSFEEKLDLKNRAKLNATKPKATSSAINAVANLKDLQAKVKGIIDDPDLGWGTGYASYLSRIPASKARQIEAAVKSIKAATSLDSLTELRSASPTGGALGNVSDAEGMRLENKRATLDEKLATGDFRKSAQELYDSLTGSINRVSEGYERDFGETLPLPKSEKPFMPPTNTTSTPMFSDPAKQSRYEAWKAKNQ